ncbi:MAG: hypothetical protein R3D45_09845 [Rhizobiaceae bacterium]
MSDKELLDHVGHLVRIRDSLVMERRACAAYPADEPKHAAKKIYDVQLQIDAIDRAIEDEKRPEPRVYEERGLRQLD